MPDDLFSTFMDDVFWLRWLRRVKPSYDDLTLFLMVLTAAALLFRDEALRTVIREILDPVEPRGFFVVLACMGLMVGGAVMTLYHFLTRAPAPDTSLTLMGIFGIGMHTVAGAFFIHEIWQDARGWLLLFPILNVLNVVILFYTVTVIPDEAVSIRPVTKAEIIIGLVATIVVFTICYDVLNMSWAATFSLCTIYLANLNSRVESIIARATTA